VYGIKKRHYLAVIFLALPILLLILPESLTEKIRLQTTSFLETPLAGINIFSRKIQDAISPKGFFTHYLAQQDARMQALVAQNAQLKEVFLERQRVEDLLSFKQAVSFKTIQANVISKDPTNWRHSIIIDKGAKNGVRKDMFLISPQGLCGRISETGRFAAKAILLTDPNFKVAAICQRSREEMIVAGAGRNVCFMKYLDADRDVQVKDIIVTSGLGGFCPKGILIGEVVSVQKSADGLTLKAFLKPSARLNSLEEVLVLVE
jgi:rod shape-determining protein MreC